MTNKIASPSKLEKEEQSDEIQRLVEAYVKLRSQNQDQYYVQTVENYQQSYRLERLSLLVIAGITVLIGITASNSIVGILGTAAGLVLAALIAYRNFQNERVKDGWFSNRLAAEELRKEIFLYLIKTRAYSTAEKSPQFAEFRAQVEAIFLDETANWGKLVQQDTEVFVEALNQAIAEEVEKHSEQTKVQQEMVLPVHPDQFSIKQLPNTQRFYAAWIVAAFLVLFVVVFLSAKLLPMLLGINYLLIPATLFASVAAYFCVIALYQRRYNRDLQQAMGDEFKRNPEFYSNLEREIDILLHD